MLLALNRPDEARAHAELALTSAPSQAHQALALIAVARKQDDEALRQAELAAAVDAGLPMPAFIRGTIAYNNQQFERAIGFLLEARQGYARRSAQAKDLNFMIGDSLARLERYQEAGPYLKEEIRLYPQHVRARAGLAMLYQSMGRGAEAERVLTDLVRDVPTRDASDTAAQRMAHVRPDRSGGGGRGRGAPEAAVKRRRRVPDDRRRGHSSSARSRLPSPLSRPSRGGPPARQGSTSRPIPTATSSSSPSTRCARTRSRPTADAPARRASTRSPRAAPASPSPTRTRSSRCRRTRAS